MPLTEIAVTAAGIALIAVLARYVSWAHPARVTEMGDGVSQPVPADAEDRPLVATRS